MSCEGVDRIMKAQIGSFGIARELPRLQRYARTLTRDEHAAEDLVHDTLLRAHDKRDTFRPGSDPTPWLLAIMRNLFVSGWRKSATERKGHDRVAAEPGEPAPPSQEHSLRLRAVAEAFDQLSDEHREVLHLVVIEGQSYRQAADMLDIPVGTLISRLSRARAALRARERLPRGNRPGLRLVESGR